MSDLAGRVIMITGSTDGLGRGVAMALADRAATLLLHGRDAARLEQVAAEARTRGAEVRTYLADFAALNEVSTLAEAVTAAEVRLDVLINNAGLGVEDHRRESADGYEMLFQVDYLAGFLLTRRLLPLLERSAPSRIVNVASAGQAPIDFDDMMLQRHWDGVQAYCQAKLAQIAMTLDLAPKLAKKGVTINALHPASMMPTKIVVGRYAPMSTLEHGIENVVRLAVDPALKDVTGRYFNGGAEARANAQAYDAHARERLREASESLIARIGLTP